MSAVLHPFENAGLGLAPFRFAGMTREVYSACQGHSQPAGTCQYCGRGVMWVCHVRSADGKLFGVGRDCVRKLDRADNRLISDMEREVARIERAEREARLQTLMEERRAKVEAELERQRVVNGGLTDYEVAEAEREAARKAVRDHWSEQNRWLIEVLHRTNGEFAQSVCETLERTSVSLGLSPKAIAICADIYGRFYGRRGSKAYERAEARFWEKVGAEV